MTPQDLKLGVTEALNALLEPIRQEFTNNPRFQEAFELAYPKPGKKMKKVKDKGSKYPAQNLNMKTGNEGADVLASEGIGEDIIANGQGTGSGGQSDAQIQSVGKSVEDALDRVTVSGDRG